MALDPSPLAGTSLPLIAGFVGLILIRLNPANVLIDTGLAAVGGALALGFLPAFFAAARSNWRWPALALLLIMGASEYSRHIPNLGALWSMPGLVELSLATALLVASSLALKSNARWLARGLRLVSIASAASATAQLWIWVDIAYPAGPKDTPTQIGLLMALYAASTTLLVRLYQIEHLPIGRCSNCGYPLAGLETNICPECGTPFTPTPTPTIANTSAIPDTTLRPPLFRNIAYRAALAMLAGLLVLWQAPGNSLERFKPNRVLRRDAHLTERYELTTPKLYPRATAAGWTLAKSNITLSTPAANRAVDELIHRVRKQTLDPGTAEALIHDILEIQNQHDRAMGNWPELFHELDAIGFVSESQRRTFFEQSIVLALVVRPRVQFGRPVPVDIIGMVRSYEGPRRTGKPWLPTPEQLATDGVLEVRAATLDGQPTTEPTTIIEHLPTRGSIFGYSGLDAVDRTMPIAPDSPGAHTIRLEVHIGFFPQQAGGITRQQWLDLGLPLSIDRSVEATFESVPDPTFAVDDITDTEFHIRAQNTNLCFLGRDETAPAGQRTKFQATPRNYFVSIGRPHAPSPVLTRAYLNADGAEAQIGWAYFERRGAVSWQSFSLDDASYDRLRAVAAPETWRFIFRSDPEMAERTTSIERASRCQDIIIPARYLGASHEHAGPDSGPP